MTEAQLILVDLFIEKMPKHEPFTLDCVYHNILHGKYDRYSQAIIDELHKSINSRDPDITNWLLDKGFISIYDASHPKYLATDPGKKTQELGGHKQYAAWKAKQDKAKRFENFPNKYWYIWTPLIFFIGYFADIFKDDVKSSILKNKSQDTTQLHHTIEVLRDSVQELLHQPKETLHIQPNPLSLDTSKK